MSSTSIPTKTTDGPSHRVPSTRAKTRSCSPKSGDVVGVSELAYAELEEMRNGRSQPSPPRRRKSSDSIPGVNSGISNGINTFTSNANGVSNNNHQQFFPMACRSLLLDIEGNQKCLDCGASRPEWAAVSYGALVCINCSGNHRSLGVQTSTVRHVTMDHWTFPQVIKMLEGGNAQIQNFFERHALTQPTFEERKQQQHDAAAASVVGDSPSSTQHQSPSPSPPSLSRKVTASSPPLSSSSSPSPQPISGLTSSAVSTPTSSSSSSSSALTSDNLHVMRYKTKAALFYRQQLDHHVQQLVQSGKPYKGRKDRSIKRRPLGTQRSTV